jgi:hypothetical protein
MSAFSLATPLFPPFFCPLAFDFAAGARAGGFRGLPIGRDCTAPPAASTDVEEAAKEGAELPREVVKNALGRGVSVA